MFSLQQQYVVLKPANSYIQGTFLEGRSGSFSNSACVLTATTKKGRQFFLHCPFPKYFPLELPCFLAASCSLSAYSNTAISVSSCVAQTHAEFVSGLTDDHERNVREIETKYQAKLRALQAQNDLRRKTELHELEERKNRQVHTLMRNHEKAFTDIKNYYNDITANNMALINTLKVTIITVSSLALR